MTRFNWTRNDHLETLVLPNGEHAGSVAKSPHGTWTVAPGCRVFPTRAEAMRAVETDADARLWFLDRVTA